MNREICWLIEKASSFPIYPTQSIIQDIIQLYYIQSILCSMSNAYAWRNACVTYVERMPENITHHQNDLSVKSNEIDSWRIKEVVEQNKFCFTTNSNITRNSVWKFSCVEFSPQQHLFGRNENRCRWALKLYSSFIRKML